MGEWEQSLWVAATVMSRSPARGLVVLDAGLKALSTDSGPAVLPPSQSGEAAAAAAAATAAHSSRACVPALQTGATHCDLVPPGAWRAGGIQVDWQSGGDEHSKLLYPLPGTVPAGAVPQLPALGDVVRLQPGHCDPTVNLYDWLVGYRGDTVQAVWPVARGPGS